MSPIHHAIASAATSAAFYRRFLMMGFFIALVNIVSADERGTQPPFKPGEKITFSIKKFNVKSGEATLEFNGAVKIGGKDAELITFRAQGFNFYDQEKIYMDPRTFFPIVVERDLDIWGKKEKITEEYQSPEGMVTIRKLAGGKASEQVIKKKGQLDNIYCFIYRYRKEGAFKVGDTLSIHLPTQDFKMALKTVMSQRIGKKDYKAFYLKSKPLRYEVWFDAGEKKIPLRINGAIGFGNTSMIMTEYRE